MRCDHWHHPVDRVDFGRTACHVIKPHRRTCHWHHRGEIDHVLRGIVERKADPLGQSAGVSLARASQGDFAPFWLGHQFTDGAIKDGARRAERDVAQELFPDQLMNVLEGAGVEPGFLP